VIVRGTHLGPLPGIPATAKRTAVMGNEIWRVIGRRTVQHWAGSKISICSNSRCDTGCTFMAITP
jgi:hypothetical protein